MPTSHAEGCAPADRQRPAARRLALALAVGAMLVLSGTGTAHDGRGAAAARADAAAYAWRLFERLNRPVTTPDCSDPEAPAQWEAWATPGEIWRADGADPGPWSRRPSRLANDVRFEVGSLKDLPNLRHPVAGRMEPVTDPLAVSEALTEVRFNRAAYDYLRRHGLYNLDGQLALARAGIALRFPAAAWAVKARWRPIAAKDRGRYHTLRVTLADGSTRLYGLTAMHVMTHDLESGFWATFEHADVACVAPAGCPSRDAAGRSARCRASTPGCDAVPRRLTRRTPAWAYYRLGGTAIDFVAADGTPTVLGNRDLEAGLGATSSCPTCHARAAVAAVAASVASGAGARRLPVLAASGSDGTRQGYTGRPDPNWFLPDGLAGDRFVSQDGVWSLALAHPRSTRPPDQAGRGLASLPMPDDATPVTRRDP